MGLIQGIKKLFNNSEENSCKNLLETEGILKTIENIIDESEEFITIISPYIKTLLDQRNKLSQKTSQNIKVDLVYGKNDLECDEKRNLHKIQNINIFYKENLHAKCYLNEKTALITSMNFYSSSRANVELGIKFSRQENQELYEKIKEISFSILNESTKINTTQCIFCKKNRNKKAREKALCNNGVIQRIEKQIQKKNNNINPKIFGEPVFKDMKMNTKKYANLILEKAYGRKYPDVHVGTEGAGGAFHVSFTGGDGKEHNLKSVYFLYSEDTWELRKCTPYVVELLAKTDKNLEASKFSDEKQKI